MYIATSTIHNDTMLVYYYMYKFHTFALAGDVFIPQVTNSLLQILCLVLLSFAMASYITPWILIAIVPIIFVFYLMKAISTVSIRQLKRLENVVRSPLISHINVTSQGLPTITAYGQQDTFYEKLVHV